MEKREWNKVLISVFKKRRFLRTEWLERSMISDGCNLLELVDGWSTKVLVKKFGDEGIVTNKFTLVPGADAEIEEYQTGEFASMNGWSRMIFRLDGHERPFLLVSIIESWYDTHYYSRFDVDAEALDGGADISAMLPDEVREAFPELKARFADNNTVAIDFEGQQAVLDINKGEDFQTPFRDMGSAAIEVYGDKHDIDKSVSIKIEVIR